MKKHIITLLLLVLCLIVFLGFDLGNLSYLKGDENYYFQVARRMIRDADYITPRYHHRIRFEKPPLYYWIVAGFFKAFGVSWRVARFSSVTLGVLTLLIIYLLALEFFGRKEALFSVLVLATNEMFFRYSRLCVSDMAFLCFISLALFLFIKSYKTKSPGLFILSFMPMGLATLTKGPLGPALIILVILVFRLSLRGGLKGRRSNLDFGIASAPQLAASEAKQASRNDKFRLLREIKNIVLGILVFLAVTLPWFIAMINIHGAAFLGHIWSVEIVSKAALKPASDKAFVEAVWYYIRNFGYYVPVVFFSFLPWSLFLPFALFGKKDSVKREGRPKGVLSKVEGNIFLLCWFWVVFIFFSLAGFKHTHYMLVLSPALAMIIATYAAKLPKKIPITIGVLSIAFFLSLVGIILPYIDDGAERVFSLRIASEIKENDQVGMASRQFNIKKFGVHLNNLISSPYELSGDDLALYVYVDKKDNLAQFLRSKKRVFVLIAESDYINYVPLELRRELHILERHMAWKKIKFNRELVKSILSGNLVELKEDAYLISNRG